MAETERPLAKQVACRLIILRCNFISGYIVPPPEVLLNIRDAKSEAEFQGIVEGIQQRFDRGWNRMRQPPFWEELSPEEKQFLSTPVDQLTDGQFTDACWRIESIQALMWCLGMIETMPPYDTRASDEPLKLEVFRDYTKLLNDAQLRPAAEIDATREEAELWHWRSRTRELIEKGTYQPDPSILEGLPYQSLDEIVRIVAQKLAGETPPKLTIDEDFAAMGKAYRDLTDDEWSDVRSITIERHLALNWVCGYGPDNRWEQTPTHT